MKFLILRGVFGVIFDIFGSDAGVSFLCRLLGLFLAFGLLPWPLVSFAARLSFVVGLGFVLFPGSSHDAVLSPLRLTGGELFTQFVLGIVIGVTLGVSLYGGMCASRWLAVLLLGAEGGRNLSMEASSGALGVTTNAFLLLFITGIFSVSRIQDAFVFVARWFRDFQFSQTPMFTEQLPQFAIVVGSCALTAGVLLTLPAIVISLSLILIFTVASRFLEGFVTTELVFATRLPTLVLFLSFTLYALSSGLAGHFTESTSQRVYEQIYKTLLPQVVK